MNLSTNTNVLQQSTCISPKETAMSQLHAAVPEGFEAEVAGLVELYRCKLCPLTSSIKGRVSTHLAHMHETDMVCQISGCPKMDRGENELYSMGDEVNQENKENEEKLAKKV